jgi:hypothetical protein
MTRRSLPLGVAFALLVLPCPASAIPLLELLGGLDGGGFQARTLGAGPASTYFNPALLPSSRDAYGISFFALGEVQRIQLGARPAGIDVDPSVYDARAPDENGTLRKYVGPSATQHLRHARRDTDESELHTYLAFGLVRRLFGDQLVFGFYALLPTAGFQAQDAFYVDETEQFFSNGLHFELLGDRLTMSSYTLALGSRLGPHVSLGIGASVGLAVAASTPVHVPKGDDFNAVQLNSHSQVKSPLSPYAGVALRPLSSLVLGLTVHAPSSLEVSGESMIQVGNSNNALLGDQRFHFTQGYDPLTVALSGSWDALATSQRRVTLAGTATWRRWSTYRNRHDEAPLDGWKDTLTASVGGRYVMPALALSLDTRLAPSPVPAQTGRTNYVDGTQVSALLGIEVDRVYVGTRFTAALSFQGHRLLPRSVDKDPRADHPVVDEYPDNALLLDGKTPPEAAGLQTNNPGYPGFESDAWLWGSALACERRIDPVMNQCLDIKKWNVF